MTEKETNEKRIRDQKIYNLQIELYQTIPGWGRIILAGLIDVIFCMVTPTILFFSFLLSIDSDSLTKVAIYMVFIVFFLIDFYFSTKTHGSTIGFFLVGIFLIKEITFKPVNGDDVINLLFLRIETDFVYNDLYESLVYMESSKKQTIAMKRNHVIYVNKRKYKKFYNARKEEIEVLYQEYIYGK